MSFELTFENKSKSAKSILLEAKKLFWKHGIMRVSVEEICKEAGVSKMTFYRNFDNKYETAKIILTEFAEMGYNKMANIFNQKEPFPIILTQFLELKREQARAVSMELLKDLYAKNEFTESLRILLEDSQKKLMNIVIHSFEDARRDGWIRKEISTPFLLYMFDHVGHLVEDEKLLAMFSNSEELTMVLTNFLFKGLLSDKRLEDE